MRFKKAGIFWRFVLGRFGFMAIAMPWRTVYLMPKYFNHVQLRYHESIHIEQMDRDGTLRFCVKYLWWLWRHGYWANPYEVEAYRRSGDILP